MRKTEKLGLTLLFSIVIGLLIANVDPPVRTLIVLWVVELIGVILLLWRTSDDG